MSKDSDSLLDFPCAFPIKVMGLAGDNFDALVVELIRRHVDDISEGAVRSKRSRGGKYVSVTVTITAESQNQLDAIYRELSGNQRVVMAL